MTTLHELVAGHAARTPDAVAVRCGARQLTYAELDAAADRLAHRLRARGAVPEQVVGICLRRSIELPVALLAVLKTGAAYLPLDPGHPQARLRALLTDAGPVTVVTDRECAAVLPNVPVVLADEPVDESLGAFAPVVVWPENLAFVLYTSGSTGAPRAVGVPHRAAVNLVRGTYVHFGPDEVFLHAAPLAFDASTFEIWGALANGARLVLLPEDHPVPGVLGALIRRERVTTFWLTAGLFHNLVADGLAELRPLRQLITGGDVVRPDAVRLAVAGLPGCRIVNGYGPTEATTFTTTQRLDDIDIAGAVPIGYPITGVAVYVLDDELCPAEIGEIYIAGAGLARGYRDAPAATAARFLPDPFGAPGDRMYRTGDRARRRPDGALEFLGRRDNQVKLRGFRIEPGEIEHALRQHPSVHDAVVVRDGDRLVAYTTGPLPADAAALRAFLAQRLPDFLVPAVVLTLPTFPLNANGKIDRQALPAVPENVAGRVAGTPAEEMLADSLARILGVERVGVDDEFFALGVHSLQVMRWLARIQAAFGVDLSVRDVFAASTVAAVATRLVGSAGVTAVPVTRTDQPLTVSVGQEALWLLDQMQHGGTGYAVPLLFALRGPLDADVLADAVAALVERHEPLRTVFPASAGHPVARPATVPFVLARSTLTGPLHERSEQLRAILAADADTPFDLAAGPLLRGRLVRRGPDDHVLALTGHHIACDGWSMAVLRHELGQHYRAIRDGSATDLPDLPVRYRDFAHWQRAELTARNLAPAIAYWTVALSGMDAGTVGIAGQRPAVARHRGRSVACPVPADLTTALHGVARAHDATLFMVLLAAFQVLLGRYGGRTDVPVGVPVAGRDRPEFDGLIGYFINLLVLRGDLHGDPTFGELLARTRESTLDAYAHRQLPFQRLVELLGAAREPGVNPIVRVAFAWQNTPPAELDLPGIHVERLEPDVTGTTFDLTLSLEETGTGLRGTIEYDQDLFTADTIDRMVGHYRTLLAAVAHAPGTRLSELPILTPAEHRQLDEWTSADPTPAAGVGAPTVTSLVADWVARTPDAVAVSAGGNEITYAQLDIAADRLAALLRARGAGPERLVGVCLRRGADLPVTLLAVLRTGAAYLPLDPDYPAARLAFMIDDARPALIVCEAATRSRLPSDLAVPLLSLVDIEAESLDDLVPEPVVHPDNLAYVMYTSGSTGTPKAVAVPHRGIVRLVTDETVYRLRGEVLLLLAPFAFDASTFEIWGALANGARLAVFPAERSALDGLGAVIRAERVTVCFLATALFHEIVDTSVADLLPLRQILIGGDMLTAPVVARALAALPDCRMSNVYGPTETVTFCSAHPLDPGLRADGGPIPIGGPVAGSPLHVLDDTLHRVPIGVSGELYVDGVAVSRGYLGRPALTAERFVPNPFGVGTRLYRTGDIVRRAVDGALEFLGRADGQVKIRGFRVETGEIEAVLRAHGAVRDAVVTVLGDDPVRRRLVASVAAEPGVDLIPYLAQRLPDYLVPSRITVLDSLPVSPVGKIDRAAIASAERDRFGAQDIASEPGKPVDAVAAGVAAVWRDVLGSAGTDRNFFDAGGNSLLLARVRAGIRDRFGRDVPMVDLFRYPTVAQLAGYLRNVEPATVDTRPAGRVGAGRDRLAALRALRTSGTTPAGGD